MIARHTNRVPKKMLFIPACYSAIQGALRLYTGTSRRAAGALRLVAGTRKCSQDCSRCSQTCCRCSQVHPKFPPELRHIPKPITVPPILFLYPLSEILVTFKAGWYVFLVTKTLRKLTHQSLPSTLSQILLGAVRDQNTSCCFTIFDT